jgi:hypothetical protein
VQCPAVLCVKKLDTLEPSQNQFPLLRLIQCIRLEHEASQNLLDELLTNASLRSLAMIYLARQCLAQMLHYQTASVVVIKLGSQS